MLPQDYAWGNRLRARYAGYLSQKKSVEQAPLPRQGANVAKVP